MAWSEEDKGGSGRNRCPLPDRICFWRSELLGQRDINEAAGRIVKKARIFCGVTAKTVSFWRILPEDVIATQGDGGVVQNTLPDRQPIIRGLGRGRFRRLPIFG